MSAVGRLASGMVCGMLGLLYGCAGAPAASAGHDRADAPACPSPTAQVGSAPPTMGCANASNLAAMLENPADLQHGRRLSPADGAREAHAVANYEKGPVAKSATSGPASAGVPLLTGGQ